MLELWLIRHAETDWRREKRHQGHSNNALSDLGKAQAERLRLRLQGQHFDAVYASDLKRAQQTAQLALPGVPLQLDPRLREVAGGVIEGRTNAELSAEELAALHAWYRDPYGLKRGGAESWTDLQDRVVSWLDDLHRPSRRLLPWRCDQDITQLDDAGAQGILLDL